MANRTSPNIRTSPTPATITCVNSCSVIAPACHTVRLYIICVSHITSHSFLFVRLPAKHNMAQTYLIRCGACECIYRVVTSWWSVWQLDTRPVALARANVLVFGVGCWANAKWLFRRYFLWVDPVANVRLSEPTRLVGHFAMVWYVE